jgi:putative copper resistance protein D
VIPVALLWLRALGLAAQCAVLGGVVFGQVLLRPWAAREPGVWATARRHIRVIQAAAGVVALAEALVLAVEATELADGGPWPLAPMLAAPVYRTAIARILVAAAAAALGSWLARAPTSAPRWAVEAALGLGLAVTGAGLSHAVARLTGGVGLVALDALHQAAAGVWLGGVLHVLILVTWWPASARVLPTVRRFAAIAFSGVAVLALTGVTLASIYVHSVAAAVGTSYGAMVLTKVALFAGLLALGGLNFLTARRAAPASGPVSETEPASVAAPVAGAPLRLRRFVEAEVGLGLTVLFVAAALSGTPLGVDVTTDRATRADIATIFTPRWPRLHAPALAELVAASPLTDATAPRTAEDTAWSEFGHNVAGLFVLAMGVCAWLERTGRARWARHWPLLFVGLSGFLMWNMDPEGWQTGLVGFWQHLADPEVLQHRIFLLLTALFGVFEWSVRRRGAAAGRQPWAYFFPVACMLSGTLLLAHTHVVNNAKEAFLMELSHLPLGLLSLAAGWARWLELRLPAPDNRWPGRLWAPALAAFGLLLILYREG